MGGALVCNNFSPISSKISFHIKNNYSLLPKFTKPQNLFDS